MITAWPPAVQSDVLHPPEDQVSDLLEKTHCRRRLQSPIGIRGAIADVPDKSATGVASYNHVAHSMRCNCVRRSFDTTVGVPADCRSRQEQFTEPNAHR